MHVAESATSVLGMTALRFAAAAQRRSHGQLKIEVYPDDQLVREQEVASSLAGGVLDLAIQSSSVLVPLVPRLQVFDMPFLFKSLESASRVLDGPTGGELASDLEPKGIVALAWGTGGFKELSTTARAVQVPDDMKGLRIRVPSGAVYVATYQALGALPISIDSSETFIALQQHTIDAVDNNLDLITTRKYYTVVRHVALLHHIFSVIPLMASKRRLETLPAPLQRGIREEAKAVLPFWRAATLRQLADDIGILKKNGVAFTEIQYAVFRKAIDPVYAAFGQRIGTELLERIARAQA